MRTRMQIIPALALVGLSAVSLRAQTNTPVRLVSLAPSLTELVCSLGFAENLVGRSSACDFPPSVLSVPAVGAFGRPSWDAVQQVRPDVVLATDLEKPGLVQQLELSGIRTLIIPCESWTQMVTAARAISAAAGDAARGETWVNDMTRRKEALAKRTGEFLAQRPRPRVYVEVWRDPLTTPGGGTFLDELVTLAGGTNIAAALPARYNKVSSEWVIREDPDVVLVAYMASESAPESVGSRLGWGQIRGVRNDRICTVVPPDLLLRPGPRWLDGAEAFSDWLISTCGAGSP